MKALLSGCLFSVKRLVGCSVLMFGRWTAGVLGGAPAWQGPAAPAIVIMGRASKLPESIEAEEAGVPCLTGRTLKYVVLHACSTVSETANAGRPTHETR